MKKLLVVLAALLSGCEAPEADEAGQSSSEADTAVVDSGDVEVDDVINGEDERLRR